MSFFYAIINLGDYMTIDMLFWILQSERPSELLNKYESQLFSLIPDLKNCKGFNQNNDWHIYDVYEHILMVTDKTDNILPLRLAALFHDVGKPYTYTTDAKGIGHFFNHWTISMDIFNDFATEENIDYDIASLASKLIYYHDINFLKIDEADLEDFLFTFDSNEIDLLFNLKRADLLSQNPKYISHMKNIDEQEKMIKRLNLTHSKKMI